MPSYSDGTFRPKKNQLEYRFYIGEKQYSVYGKSKKDCYTKRTEKLLAKPKKEKTITILIYKDWLENWYETYKKPYLKPSTNRAMIYHLKMINENLGETPIKELTKEKLQLFINEQSSFSKKRNLKLILNESLEEALEEEKIEKNPASKLKLPKNETKHRKALTFEQQTFFIDKIDNEKYKAIFIILCCTGMRVGELLALDFAKDIDYINNRIHVSKTKDIVTGEIQPPKTKTSTRYVPFLNELKKEFEIIKNEEISYNSIKLFFDRFYKKYNITDISIHCFRHTFVSLCYHAKLSDKKIQEILGHASLDMTLNIYTHLLSKGNSEFLDYVKHLKTLIENQ